MNESLLERTRRLLEASKERRPDIAVKAGVTYEWLKKFCAPEDSDNRIENPGINHVQKLHDYLARQTIETSQCRNVG